MHRRTTRPAPPGPSRAVAALATLTTVAALALAGCSSDDEGASPDPADPQATAGQSTMGRVNPLTGKPMAELPPRPVLAFKIDNSGNNAQVGLSKADLVVEELVEGGITRLAAIYYGKVPKVAGPMRSMRATDIGIVLPLGATLVASGGAPPTVRRMKAAGIRTVTEGAPGYYRGPGYAPYNLFMDVTRLTEPMKRQDPAPPAYFPFGDAELPKGKPAKRFTTVFSRASATSFEARKGRYVNTDSNAAAGDDFTPDTVIVMRVRVGDAGYLDPSGATVPETMFTGRGPAMVFHDGRVVRATWVKDGFDAVPTLRTPQGPIEIPPGKVRLQLVPRGDGDVRIG